MFEVTVAVQLVGGVCTVRASVAAPGAWHAAQRVGARPLLAGARHSTLHCNKNKFSMCHP